MLTLNDIFNIDNLELSFQRLKSAPKRTLHKEIYWEALKDIEPFRSDYFEFLIEKFKDNQNIAKYNINRVYLPKKNGFVRPITYIGLESLLIYQAIANKLISEYYPSISNNYNKITFGNHFNSNFNSEFQLRSWKKCWKRYQEKSKDLIDNRDLSYVVEFDIASFYDSIDHKLLKKALKKNVDELVIELLISILELSHSNFKHIQPGSGSGIPQGPSASIVISELFLHYYIDNYFYDKVKGSDIDYTRYADDIRVFASNKNIAKKYITILDLLCRDSGLIPQTSKVDIIFYQNSRDMIDQDIQKFSNIQKKFNISKTLKSKDSKKAEILIIEMLKNKDINKTKFNFFMYKIGKNNEIKDLILLNLINIYEFCDPIIYYLKKYYLDDSSVKSFLIEHFIENNKFFLDYPLYIFLKYYYTDLEFNSRHFFKLFNDNNNNKWLSKIILIKWAELNDKKEIIDSIDSSHIKNELLKREIMCAQYRLTKDLELQKVKEKDLLKYNKSDLVFKSISLMYGRVLFKTNLEHLEESITNNPLLNKIINSMSYNTVSQNLKEYNSLINNPDNLFNYNIFNEKNEFSQLSLLSNFILRSTSDYNYKLFIDSIDQFNQIMVERMFIVKTGARPESYGSILQSENFLYNELIGVQETLRDIHSLRCGDLHPKNLKTGIFNSTDNSYQNKKNAIDYIVPKWLKSIDNILHWYNTQKKDS